MEAVEDLLRGLQLTEAERRGVNIGWVDKGKEKNRAPQAMGKLLSKRLASAEAIARSVGKIWCPMKGVECKQTCDNIFLFTFRQPEGKRKALSEGPWMFGNKELIIMEDYDPSKTSDQYAFSHVPIWIRVANIPLGAMTWETGERIGRQVGDFQEVDVDEDGQAVGQYLRVKVRIKVDEVLMRGSLVTVIEGEPARWCPFTYEFLPDFCFTCGRIGHCNKACSIKLKPGEKQPFGKWLKAVMNKKAPGEDDRKS